MAWYHIEKVVLRQAIVSNISNIRQMELGTPDSIFYGLYCCNYDVKVVICAGNIWHFEGRIVTLQFKDVTVKSNSLKLIIACGAVLHLLEQCLCFSVILWMYCIGMCFNRLMIHLGEKSAMDWIKVPISSEPVILIWRYRNPCIRGPMFMLAAPKLTIQLQEYRS